MRKGLSEIPALIWPYLIKSWANNRWEVPSSNEIDIVNAKELHAKGAVFIDMSDPWIWDYERIPGAINLPGSRVGEGPWDNVLKKSTLEAVADKNEAVVFYRCWADIIVCGRGEGMTARAISWGYKKVYYLVGGTIAWKEAGYPVESKEQ